MHAELERGTLLLRFGRRFDVSEAERISDAIRHFSSLRHLTLDFTDVREFQDPAYAVVAETLIANPKVKILVCGLTLRRGDLLRRELARARGRDGIFPTSSPALIPLSC